MTQPTTETVELTDDLERGTSGIPCTCNGYAERVDCTDEEDRKYGCGRKRCCAVAFVCRVCGKRLVGSYEAPEME